MNSSSKTSNKFIQQLSRDYPDLNFQQGEQEHWSPKTNTITFSPSRPSYVVLHELAHAILKHSTYQTDFELLKLEANAWGLASKIGLNYNITITQNHIQNCLDTYRDWLHRRSTCPSCGTHTLQKDSSSYLCFNCSCNWHVSSSRFVRSYRKMLKTKTA